MEKEIFGLWKGLGRTVSIHLPLIMFEEDGNQIIYCPPLDLSGYGPTEVDARASFNVMMDEYFRYTINKGTLAEDLKSMGWKLTKKNLKKPVTPPDISYTLSTNEEFKRIFNNFDFHKGNTEVAIPAIY